MNNGRTICTIRVSRFLNRYLTMKQINFKLKKDFGEYKKGEVFSHFNGTVHGIHDNNKGTAYFSNKEMFKHVKNQKPTT